MCKYIVYYLSLLGATILQINSFGQAPVVFPGADELTPSRAQYFSWINNTNEGATEAQTMINLNFFKWLNDEYGMQLDIYAFDAGAIDGKRFYGSIYSDRFKSQFPNGFDPIYKYAKGQGIRLGVWGGPDGFGDTPEEEKARTDEMVKLCRDYEFELFKFDAVCGPLRPEREDAFINMMIECRKYSPDLILLNHRLGLNKSKPYATTFLWGGRETYIDVFTSNSGTASHHRAGALEIGLVPGLQRLTEDHGVCISSCLDYWEDDLVLQSFSRNLILAPEIYGNPWFLRDNEFAKLARIFNLHRKFRNILVEGMVLPESYGPHALVRGNSDIRLITLRNLTWTDTVYRVKLDEEIGLQIGGKIEVRQFHPFEKIVGFFKYGDIVEITVPSFRSSLVYIGNSGCNEPAVEGLGFNVISNVQGEPLTIQLLGGPGTTAKVKLASEEKFKKATIDGIEQKLLAKGGTVEVKFPGKKAKHSYNRKLSSFVEIPVPDDASTLYEATVFAADNNALEVRSIQRSGWSSIPQVKEAQMAFFEQDAFVDRGVWDKNLFDGNMDTGFWPSRTRNRDMTNLGGCFRLDLGEEINVDEIVIKVPNFYALHPFYRQEGNHALVSTDMENWKTLTFLADTTMSIPVNGKIRYLKLNRFPQQIVEVSGYKNGQKINSEKWRASNLFASTEKMIPQKAWKSEFVLDELADGSYLCVAINGVHGIEGAYAAAKIDGVIIGAPDRALSFPSNTWESPNRRSDKNYTYYIPLKKEMENKRIEIFVMGYTEGSTDLAPEVYLTAYPMPFEHKELVLYR